MLTKAVIYCRFSPRPNAEECESNEIQLEECTKRAGEKGYEIAGRFMDEVLKGDDEERPGLWAAIATLRRGWVLLVHKGDRLARSVYMSEYLYREVRKLGATIEVVTGGGNGTNPEDVLIRQILAASAEYEKKCIAARTKAAMLRHQANGRAMSAIPPLGQVRGPDRTVIINGREIVQRTLIEDEAEQQLVQRIIGEWKRGKGIREIARLLTAEGIPTKTGGATWDHQTVRKLLKRNGIKTGARGVGFAAVNQHRKAKVQA